MHDIPLADTGSAKIIPHSRMSKLETAKTKKQATYKHMHQDNEKYHPENLEDYNGFLLGLTMRDPFPFLNSLSI